MTRTQAFLVAALAGACQSRLEPRDATPHELHQRGECADCHETAPVYHRELEWEVVHGRAEPAGAHACGSCHAPDTCVACHTRAPATHRPGFRAPGRSHDGAVEHALLASLRPSACAACHGPLQGACTSCHPPGEVEPWAEEAARTLAPWSGLLEGGR